MIHLEIENKRDDNSSNRRRSPGKKSPGKKSPGKKSPARRSPAKRSPAKKGASPDFGEAFAGKRTFKPLQSKPLGLNLQLNLQSPLPSSRGTPSSVNGFGLENTMKLLQQSNSNFISQVNLTNLNHISQMGGFGGLRKPAKDIKDGLTLRDSIKSSIRIIGQGINYKNFEEKELRSDKKVDNSGNNTPKPDTSKKPSPSSIELRGGGKRLQPERMRTFVDTIKSIPEEVVPDDENGRVGRQKKHTRSNSIGMFQQIHREESLTRRVFPSLQESE